MARAPLFNSILAHAIKTCLCLSKVFKRSLPTTAVHKTCSKYNFRGTKTHSLKIMPTLCWALVSLKAQIEVIEYRAHLLFAIALYFNWENNHPPCVIRASYNL